eukprot:TRINITY_DN12029_c0_g1_i6.p1 TRINITY_DN12029_c0_g1~~TRINITY_DN12029_c0_g1_i6.p1  ORF type:complete len:193 (-),score=22.86 TRINITY_DN12029_c0_g1_i6:93-671(-)
MQRAVLTYQEIQQAATARKIAQIFRHPVVLFFQATKWNKPIHSKFKQYLQTEMPKGSEFLLRYLKRRHIQVFQTQIQKRQDLLARGKLQIPDEVLNGHIRGKVNSLLELPPQVSKNSRLIEQLTEGPSVAMCLRITNQAETKNKEEKEDKDDLDDVDMIGQTMSKKHIKTEKDNRQEVKEMMNKKQEKVEQK